MTRYGSLRIRLGLACAGLALSALLAAAEFDRSKEPAFVPEDELGFGAASDEFSLIAIPQQDHLRLMLERFGAAQAVTKAQIELHSVDKQSKATEIGDGIYRADDAWLLEPGKKALAITVSTESIRDVLVIVFDPAQAGAARRDPKYGPRQSEATQP